LARFMSPMPHLADHARGQTLATTGFEGSDP